MLVFAMVAHEYAHGAAAFSQGDDTAYMLGRMTLNPIPHIDPLMSIVLPAVLWFGSHGAFTFGGAKPVPVNPRKYRKYRRGDIIVSAAGVVTNFGLALVCALVFALAGVVGHALPDAGAVLNAVQRMLAWGIWINLLLCFFNLIPIPPLDGSHIFYHLLPPAIGSQYRALYRFGFIPLLVLLLFLPGVTNWLLTPAFLSLNALFRLIAPFQLESGLHLFA
ncbi:MAG TPA: site-2 protease family protein [Gemmatimonadales bacterium]|jgi:Zn-dependent protease|nr:site-2 protease family protein [Gemmatimonadales bacterium]